MKNLFSGSLGRLNNYGGSRMFTTPNTISVPPEYEIETDVPSVAEFVTCTLDGRLWVWKRSRRYYVSAFRWNEETERLEFVSTTILNGETVQKRGVDWILTDKSFLQSQVEAPYISRTEYDSDDTTYSDAIEKCYSFWPELETWQEITAQKLNIEDSPNDKWKEVTQNLITPLEFHYYSDDDIQTITDFNPQICYCDGKVYAKGKAHIGRAYLLPCTFNTNGEVINFYLYISPDYLREYDSGNQTFNNDDGWNKLNIAPLDKSSVAVFTTENDDSDMCKKAENGSVLVLPQDEQRDFSVNNGAIFFDGLTHSNLILNDNGASFLRDNLYFECKCLKQWVTPSMKVENISPQSVNSLFDNGTIITYIQKKFYREILLAKLLTNSLKSYAGKVLSLGNSNSIENKKNIHINQKDDTELQSFIIKAHYEEIYLEIISIWTNTMMNMSVNFFWETFYAITLDDWDYYYSKISILSSIRLGTHGYEHNTYYSPPEWFLGGFVYGKVWLSPYPMYADIETGYGRNIKGNSTFNLNTYERITLYYIDYNTNTLKSIQKSFDIAEFCSEMTNITYDSRGRLDTFDQSILYVHSVIIRENKIGIIATLLNAKWSYDPVTAHTNIAYPGQNTKTEIFIPLFDIPEEIKNWRYIPKDIEIDIKNFKGGDYISLEEPYSNMKFYGHIPTPHASIDRIATQTFYDTNSLENGVYTHVLHVAQDWSYREWAVIFKSELHPEIFDFASEVERSKLS